MDDLLELLRESSFDWDLEVAVSRCREAADRIEELTNRNTELEAALDDMAQYVSRADWHYIKPETREALGEKKDD